MRGGEMIAIPIVIITIAVAVTTIVRLLLENIRRAKSERLQADLYAKMLDRFGTSQDLLAYLQTEAGMNLLRSVPIERTGVHSRILNAAQFGVIGVVAGAALLYLSTLFAGEPHDVFTVIGTLVLAAGAGLLLAGAAAYALSRHLHLLNGAKPESD